MKKITFLAIILISSLGIAQQVVVQNFETPASFNLNPFEGLSGSIQPDPVAGGSRINSLKLESFSTGQTYQGCQITQTVNSIKLTTDKTVKIDVFSTVAFTMLAKAEVGSGPNSGASQSYTTPNTWQTLTFTFNQGLDGTVTADGSYASVTLFPNWNPNNTGFLPASNFTLYVDNITSEATPILPPFLPTIASPTPTTPNSEVLSIYGDTGNYTNIWTSDYSFGGNEGNPDLDPSALENKAIKMNFANQGWGQGKNSAIDISAYNYVNFDYYSDTESTQLRFIMIGGGEFAYELTTAAGTLIQNSWQRVSVPLSFFTGLGFSKTNFLQYKLGTTSNLVSKIVFFDNIYLSTTNLATSTFETFNVRMYPNPAKNLLNIEAKSNIENVSIYNLLGQEVVSVVINKESTSLDIANLQAGIYVVKTSIDGKIASSRLIKE